MYLSLVSAQVMDTEAFFRYRYNCMSKEIKTTCTQLSREVNFCGQNLRMGASRLEHQSARIIRAFHGPTGIVIGHYT